jgi:hypothetical protein
VALAPAAACTAFRESREPLGRGILIAFFRFGRAHAAISTRLSRIFAYRFQWIQDVFDGVLTEAK